MKKIIKRRKDKETNQRKQKYRERNCSSLWAEA
jgi:hypothetical protein